MMHLIKKLAALPILVLLCACNDDRPAADLTFIDLARVDQNFELTFQSDVQIIELFSKTGTSARS